MPVPTEWANKIVDAMAGSSKSSLFPDTLYVALYDDDPDDTDFPGSEISGGGYARLGPLDMTSGSVWPAGSEGEKSNQTEVEGTESTGAWSDVATWAQLVDAVTGTPSVYGPTWQLEDPISVVEAGAIPVLPVGSVVLRVLDLATDFLEE